MCEPVTISMGVMAAAGAATSIAGQSAQKKAGEQMQERQRMAVEDQIAETRRRATSDYLRQMTSERIQQQQEEASVAVKGNDLTRQATKIKGTALASAAERGVMGRTVDQVVSDYDTQADLEIGRIKQNQAAVNLQHDQNRAIMKDQFNQRVSSVKPYVKTPQAPVNYFGPIFGAAAQTIGVGAQTGAFKGLAEQMSTSSKLPEMRIDA